MQEHRKGMPDQAFSSVEFDVFSLRIHALSTCTNIVFRSVSSAFFLPKAKMTVQSRPKSHLAG